MTNIVSDALLILRILTEFDDPTILGSQLKAESGLDDTSFDKTLNYLMQAKYIQTTYGAIQCWANPPGIEFLNNEMQKRIPLSLTAEKIARFLFSKHPRYTANANQIKEAVGCDEDVCQQVIIELIDERLAEDFLKSTNTARISVVKLTSLGRRAVRNNFIRQFGGATIMENNKFEVNLGDGNVFYNSDLVVAEKIKNSFNEADSAEVSDELKGLLQELAIAVGKMSETLPEEEARRVAQDLESLTSEATSKKPDKRRWEFSIEGLKQAAKNTKEVGIPVLELATRIVAILSGLPTS